MIFVLLVSTLRDSSDAPFVSSFLITREGRSKSAYSPTAINDDAVTPAMVEGYGEEGYNENTSLLDH